MQADGQAGPAVRRLVFVALDEKSSVGRWLGASNVCAQIGLRVGLGAGEEGALCCGDVLCLAAPCLEGGLLEGSAVRKGH